MRKIWVAAAIKSILIIKLRLSDMVSLLRTLFRVAGAKSSG